MDGLVEKLKALVNEFDPAALLPDLGSIVGWVELFTRACVMAAPLILLLMGLIYLIMPPKEANHSLGYRIYFGMGSVEAWRFTQKLAGIVWSVLGLGLSIAMWLISKEFKGMDVMEMADKAVLCVLWELGIIAVCCLIINLVVTICYNRKGVRRFSKKQEEQE